MKRVIKVVLWALLIAVMIGLAVYLLRSVDVAVLNPKGTIADQQRNLLVFTVLLSLVVVIPVFTLLFFISWKYREGNKKATYTPEKDHNTLLEIVWWGIPCVIILVLSIITWKTSHDLDPYKALESDKKPIAIQVVALQWKWLFIYPEQGIATTNVLQFPEKTPLNFTITADAPMNSFWIPSLGGQVYAMSGMSTKLHLMADEIGDYKGVSANVSGEGFASMRFTAKSVSHEDFDAWVKAASGSSKQLDLSTYNELAKPAILDKPQTYALKDSDLYDTIVMKYMTSENHHDKNQNNSAETNSHDANVHTHNMTESEMEGM